MTEMKQNSIQSNNEAEMGASGGGAELIWNEWHVYETVFQLIPSKDEAPLFAWDLLVPPPSITFCCVLGGAALTATHKILPVLPVNRLSNTVATPPSVYPVLQATQSLLLFLLLVPAWGQEFFSWD